jgi:hypothetical protein
MRFFNTAGPCREKNHYYLPPLARFNLEEILSLIDQEKYFLLHAPRQTGKTTCLLALMDYLNNIGKYECLYINVESGQGAREDVKRGIRAILNELASRANLYLSDDFMKKNWKSVLDETGEDGGLNEILTLWANESSHPRILLIDEIDSLVGDTLISVLRQLRSGYDKRPAMFPQSIILCGLRDIRDYRIHSSSQKEIITGGSAFNIKAESLRLGDFSKEEVKKLYELHTKETGQKFDDNVIDLVWEYSEGQPWLVNALAYEVCFKIKENRDRNVTITGDMILSAKENIILRRETHTDQLADKLGEERLKRVIEPILNGTYNPESIPADDIEYVFDLGLIKKRPLRIANGIYREVVPRELTYSEQETIYEKTSWYVSEDGMFDIKKLLTAFQKFFRKHSEAWLERFNYKEAGPQLLMQAFLQRIVNSGGRVEREYGLGKMRTDSLVTWFCEKKAQEVVIELKIKYDSLEKTIQKGMKQTAKYMDKCGTSEGHLVIFDRNENKSWDEKIFCKEKEYGGYSISVWGM